MGEFSKEPLRRRELAKLEKEAKDQFDALKKGKGYKKSKAEDTYKAFMILRYTGCHVSVLCTPKFNLHEEWDDENRRIIVWFRPKKKGAMARTTIVKNPALKFDVEDFVKDVYKRRTKRSRQYFHHIIKELGKKCDYPETSPQTLRHSLAVELLNMGATEKEVAEILNCSIATLRNFYGKYTDSIKADTLVGLGWATPIKKGE